MPVETPWSLEAIAARLVATRIALGHEQQNEYAEAAGINPSAYNNYEQAIRRISIENALLLCAEYKLTLDWIYRGDASGMSHQRAKLLEDAVRAAAS